LPPPLQSKEKPTTTTTESWKPFLSIPFTLYYDTHTFPPVHFAVRNPTTTTTTKKRHPPSIISRHIVSKRTKSKKEVVDYMSMNHRERQQLKPTQTF
jgi:hypothetical protein